MADEANENWTSQAQTSSGMPILGLGPCKELYVLPSCLRLIHTDSEAHFFDCLDVEWIL